MATHKNNNSQAQKDNTLLDESDGDLERKTEETRDERMQALEEKYETASAEAKQAYDRFLRTSAEFENFKKRKTREMSDFRKFANESLLKALLPVVDNLERAIVSIEKGGGESSSRKNDPGIDQGIKMILGEFTKAIEKYAVKPIESAGKPFDPCFHQAVFQEENTEYPENTVLSEIQKGYMLHDRLLRPAMVVVSKSTKTNKTDKE